MSDSSPPPTPSYGDPHGPVAHNQNPAGRVALTVGIVLAACQLISTALTSVLPYLAERRGQSLVDMLMTLNAVTGWVSIVLGLIAVIVGAIGLSGPKRPRGSAAAGLALGAFIILMTIIGIGVPAFIDGVMPAV